MHNLLNNLDVLFVSAGSAPLYPTTSHGEDYHIQSPSLHIICPTR